MVGGAGLFHRLPCSVLTHLLHARSAARRAPQAAGSTRAVLRRSAEMAVPAARPSGEEVLPLLRYLSTDFGIHSFALFCIRNHTTASL